MTWVGILLLIVCIWLAFERQTGCLVGICGFLELPSAQTEPQLVYSLFERFDAVAKREGPAGGGSR